MNLRALAILIFAALFVGCSKTPNAISVTTAGAAARPKAAAISDPCKLLTQAEATAAMGDKVGPGELTQIQNVGPRCRFFDKAQDEIYVDVADPSLFDTYAQLGGTPVPGIGDKTLWLHNQTGSWLHIMKNGNMISLGMPSKVASATPGVLQAGKAIASRMP